MDKKYFTARELAERYQRCEETIRRWAREGKLKYVKIAHVFYFPVEEHLNKEFSRRYTRKLLPTKQPSQPDRVPVEKEAPWIRTVIGKK